MAGSDMEKAADLAQNTYQGAVSRHGHHGRAFVETLVMLCREHPNLVGIGVGLLVEQLLSEEKREFDRKQAQLAATAKAQGVDTALAPETDGAPMETNAPAPTPALPAHEPAGQGHEARLRLHAIRPGRLALEVFGGLLLLKFGVAAGRIFGRKRVHHDGWFAAAAKIHLLSASIATYYFAKSLRSEKVSAWRNAAVALFGTDAIKPLLKPAKRLRVAA
jgi:hypothetical protein